MNNKRQRKKKSEIITAERLKHEIWEKGKIHQHRKLCHEALLLSTQRAGKLSNDSEWNEWMEIQ